jgi:hypothetical protein
MEAIRADVAEELAAGAFLMAIPGSPARANRSASICRWIAGSSMRSTALQRPASSHAPPSSQRQRGTRSRRARPSVLIGKGRDLVARQAEQPNLKFARICQPASNAPHRSKSARRRANCWERL